MQPKSIVSRFRWKRILQEGMKAKEFWSKLWDNPVLYKEGAEWLKEVKLELENVNAQENVRITKEHVKIQLRRLFIIFAFRYITFITSFETVETRIFISEG